MIPRLAAITIAAAALVGCGIPLDSAAAVVLNSCETSADCGGGASCASIGGQNQCVTAQADLAGLLVEVSPGGGSGSDVIEGISYLIDPSNDVALTGNVGSVRYDVELPAPVVISEGRIFTNPDDSADPLPACVAADGSIPAKVLLRRAAAFGGMPAAELTVETVPAGDPLESFVFSASVPPGNYDLYVTPTSSPVCIDGNGDPLPAVLPPFYIASQMLGGEPTLNVNLPMRQHLTGTLTVPQVLAIDGWTLALVEPESGLEISTVQEIKAKADLVPTEIDVDYYWSFEGGGSPIIRLRAPEPTYSPAIHWVLANVDVNGDSIIDLVLGALDDKAVHVEASVLDADGTPVVSTVTIRSANAGMGKNVAYQVVVETDSDGRFVTDLFPGDYQAFAQPKIDQTSAIGSASWSIHPTDQSGDCFCGHAIELPAKALLQGSFATPAGVAMEGAAASAVPSVSSKTPYLEAALGAPTLEPRPVDTTIDGGVLSMAVDHGIYDLSVQPPNASRFPWVVRPRLDVADGDTVVQLGGITVPYPAALWGALRGPDGGAIAGASLRAWLPIADEDGQGASSVVQVAETTSGADGTYVLVLPPRLGP